MLKDKLAKKKIFGVINIIELNLIGRKLKITPTQLIVFSYLTMITIGTVLLSLPAASKGGRSIELINAFFTAASAVCVGGFAVVDTGMYWTVFGQLIIILLVQIGALGIMTMSTLFALLLGRRITLKERLIIQESLNQFGLEGLVRLTRNIIIVTLTIELIGAVIFSAVFIPEYGVKKGIAFGVFHSISSFCNAGFDLIGEFRSFTPYINNLIININTAILIIIGGLGFPVWMDTYNVIKKKDFKKISLHSKIVLTATIFLIITGAAFIFAMESNNPETIKNLPFSQKIMASLFHSISTRSAGYTTLDMASLTTPTLLLTIVLMFIGGSPGSTAAGIKTTTAAILVITVIAVVKGKEDAEIFERRLPKYLVYRAMAVAAISLTLVVVAAMVLSITENADFMTLFFEAASAFGTVGLTLGYSPNLSLIGKIIISITMFAGRVGPLTLVIAFAKRASGNKGSLKYPEDRIMVG
jgi:trk system potassium uptake protein TrkH